MSNISTAIGLDARSGEEKISPREPVSRLTRMFAETATRGAAPNYVPGAQALLLMQEGASKIINNNIQHRRA